MRRSGTIPRPRLHPALFLPPALAFGAALPLVAGCGEGGAVDGGATVAVDTVDGVEVLRYPAARGPRLEGGPDTLFVLGGAAAGEEHYQFDQVPTDGLAGDAEGRLYVLDGQGKRVLVYDSTGRHVRTLGSEGSGPGELQGPSGLALGADGAVRVLDTGNRRLQLFGPDGEPRGSVPFPSDELAPAGKIEAPGDGWLATLSTFFFRPGEDIEAPPVPLVRFGPEGSVRDTLWTAPARPRRQVTMEGPSGPFFMLQTPTFFPRFRWAALSDGTVALSDTAAYVVHFVDAGGRRLRTLRRAPPPRPVTEADREAARERLRSEFSSPPIPGLPDAEAMLRQRLENMTFEDVVPRIQGLAVDGGDRLWVAVAGDSPGEGIDRIDLFDRTGRLVGEIRDPPFFPDLLYGDGLAALRDRDELDVQRVVVVRWAVGGA